jgi:hypothetical protein
VIDATQAALRGFAAVLARSTTFNFEPTQVPPSDLVSGRVIEGWSNQRDDLILPTIEIDVPVAGESFGRTATVIAQEHIVDATFLWTVHFGTVEIPLQLRVSAESKVERSKIDEAIDIWLLGDDFDGTPIAVSDPIADYYDQAFQYRRAGATRYFDSVATAGRDEFTSMREIEATGSQVLQFYAPGLVELSTQLKVVEAGRSFDLVVGEDVTIFDASTP